MARFNSVSNLEVMANVRTQQVFGRHVRYTRALFRPGFGERLACGTGFDSPRPNTGVA
jgi:hypothetical protein